ncbi:hypothetical protein MRB53_025804 [Persea americana]|uniref:Uncharacterized protein n=1 Tax=Persea americana TaxID=3435 RepID=A0ACC2LGK3_PERAE|nr:hypothetical protein MRB53_025804 [Persea americana]
MERLQGPINPGFFGEHLNVEPLEEGNALDFSYLSFLNAENSRLEDPFSNPSFQDKMPFLQMLEGFEFPPISSRTEPNFQLLLRMQQEKNPWKKNTEIPPLELESCITHTSESLSPVKSETKDQQYPHSSSYPEVVSSNCIQTPNSPEKWKKNSSSGSSFAQIATQLPPIREKRKRKRTRPSKNSEEVENQRMTHIAVERNRRKQMNEHLNSLRSLMPTSFIQRGDQASIIGGAIDFIKELEQLLQSLQAQKQRQESQEEGQQSPSSSSLPFNEFFRAENRSAVADIEVSVIQTHVNLKILSERRPGQLLKAIAALEDLYLAVLHLNVTSTDRSVLYSFNLKIEEGCKLGSADDIATAVHHIFSFINSI